MKKQGRIVISILCSVLLMISMFSPKNVMAATDGTVDITILETSDLHGTIYPHDYATDKESNIGLAKAATVIAQERAIDPDLILVDCGDALQGNFISDFRFDEVHPMVKAMNLLKYDVWELGNHEFNYEFDNLKRAIAASNATVLGGNIYKADGTRFVDAYKIMDVKGVKVAVFGIEAPHVTRWESDASHYDKMTFTSPMEETGKILKELEGKADVIIGLVHYGEEGEYDTEGMDEVAKKYGDKVDAFLLGHSHATVAKYLVNGEFTTEYSKDAACVVTEPGSNAAGVSKVVLTVNTASKKVVDQNVSVLPTKDAAADAAMLKELEYVHTKSVETANTVVGQVGETFYEDPYWLPGIPYAVIEDGALIDLINEVQMKETNADVSLAALFDSSSNLTKGDFKKKDGVKVYKYDNTLMAVKITGAQLKAIMERQAGGFFNQYQDGDVTISFNPNVRLYNYDMFAGVDYEIDISQPVGQRIQNVMYKGAPLKDDEQLVLALNNYRYGGLSKDGVISDKPEDLVYDSAATADIPAVRDMISAYVAKKGTITPNCDHNWKITGYDFEYPETELVYEMIRSGEIEIPKSADGRDSNVKAVNIYELYEEGILTSEEEADPETEEEIDETQKEEPECETAETAVYTVVKGDTMGKIANRHGCTLEELKNLNPSIKNISRIYVGDKVIVPAQKDGEYIVVKGDALYKIANAYGCSIETLLKLNPSIKNKNLIYAGQKLQIPA